MCIRKLPYNAQTRYFENHLSGFDSGGYKIAKIIISQTGSDFCLFYMQGEKNPDQSNHK